MFYRLTIKDHVRVPPHLLNNNKIDAITKTLEDRYLGLTDRELGTVIAIGKISEIGKGVIIPGDGAAYYDCTFDLYVFKPELQEVVAGKVVEITEFGAFVNIGPFDAMVHISQTMDDIVTFSKSKVLSGKQTKRTLKIGDKVKARIVAISYKDVMNPKIGLTMRQPYLGKEEWWIEEEEKK